MKSDVFPALLTAAPTDIDDYYAFRHVTTERVAGRICDVVALEPRDKLRYGYRLWSDRDSGLLLKAQTLNERGEVIEQVSFTDLAIGGNIDKTRVQPTFASTDGWQTESFKVTPANLTAEGWSIGSPIGGFRRIMEVRRMLERDHEVGQIVYSDGLATISIFVEPVKAGPFPIRDLSRGPINIVSRRQGDQQLTVIGEVPVAAIHQVANSVEFKAPK
jgi:sigma-E factor negative regulatory protein RseB